MKDLISVIIPVYNVEEYLDRCLDSVVRQKYSNLEIILINDGSTDQSGEICNKWIKEDNRIKVIHQKNQGVSAARNAGLNIATGNFIGFVDPDDVISFDMYSSMIENMRKTNADVVACGVSEIFLDGSKHVYKEGNKPIKLDKDQAINQALILSNDIGGVVWDKLWKREIVNDVRFNTSLSIAEDRLFCIMALLKCNYFYRDFTPKYYCIKREKSATQSKFSQKNFDIVLSAELARSEVISHSNDYMKVANLHLVIACMDVIHAILKINGKEIYEKEYEKIIQLLKSISIRHISKEVSNKFKIQFKMIKTFPNLYIRLWQIRKGK
ncbi:glycosyltransferase [Clostridium sp. NSJ-145]|uniref:glycosyltransferase family 2 protein n=1 Tax=Clostridium sp. NSJ-145 TaxID=2897777 RepID=UPI001E3BD2B7|nr:glycosyltransferase [Clostridium sp. NSJ-145]MCD2502360.1 glycosyltransferase [Clostridium sp. NSJ-145]